MELVGTPRVCGAARRGQVAGFCCCRGAAPLRHSAAAVDLSPGNCGAERRVLQEPGRVTRRHAVCQCDVRCRVVALRCFFRVRVLEGVVRLFVT